MAGQLRLPADKLARLSSALIDWGEKRSCTRKELESLIGHLNHACKVVRSGRSFLRRMIDPAPAQAWSYSDSLEYRLPSRPGMVAGVPPAVEQSFLPSVTLKLTHYGALDRCLRVLGERRMVAGCVVSDTMATAGPSPVYRREGAHTHYPGL